MTSKKTVLITLLTLTFAGFGGSLTVLSSMYLYLNPQLPAVDTLRDFRLQVPLRVFSSDGLLIGEFGEQRRTPIKFDEIPQTYIDALLAAEDADFFSHNGVSIKGLFRAVAQLVLTGRKGSGGSTITMQVARNYYLSLKRIYSRKFKEILLAIKIEKELSKEEILELYVNVLYLGNRAYGIRAASQIYYGKPLSELSLAQTAMIAGLPKGPSTMNPIVNPERALMRRDWILERMLELKLIDKQAFSAAVDEPVTAKFHSSAPEVSAPYIAEMARAETIEKFGLGAYTDGYSVYTTINSSLQKSANSAVINGVIEYDERHGYRGPEQKLSPLATLEGEDIPPDYTLWIEAIKSIPVYGDLVPAAVVDVKEQSLELLLSTEEIVTLPFDRGLDNVRPYISESRRGPKFKDVSDFISVGDVVRLKKAPDDSWTFSQLPDVQAALVSINSSNGAIISLVGGFDFAQSHFNRITQAKRQPGSNFKPFVYTAALENGMTPATLINDAPIVFDDTQLEGTWRPENDTGKFYGPTRLREALYRSRNLVSIRILREIGITPTISSVSRFGFDAEKLPRDLSLTLGTGSLTPLEIATGYAAFANGGFKIEPYFIEKIVDSEGRIIFEHFPKTVCRECESSENSPTPPPFPLIEDIDNTEYNEVLSVSETDIDPFDFPLYIKTLLNIAEPADFPRAPRILDKQTAFLIDSILKDVVKRGTGWKAGRALKRRDLGGKTGTTNGPNDAWFSGYNSSIVTTSWVGFDQFQPLGNSEYGGTAAMPIWIDFMKVALSDSPENNIPQPPGIVSVKIDPETGLRAKPADPDAVFEYFRTDEVPPSADEETQTPYETNREDERLTEELF